MPHAFLGLHLGEQAEPDGHQLAGTEQFLRILRLDRIRRLDQVVRKDLQLKREVSELFHGVRCELDGRSKDRSELDLLLVSDRGDEVPDARFAHPDRFLGALEKVGIEIERTDLALLQQPAIARVLLDRRQRMGIAVKDLQLEAGGSLEPVNHPGELRTAGQDAELTLLRFYLHHAVRPKRAWVDLQGNNAVTAENLAPPTLTLERIRTRPPPALPRERGREIAGRASTLKLVLATRLLTKRYGSLTAVEDLDLEG